MSGEPKAIELKSGPPTADTKAGLQDQVEWLEQERRCIAGEHESLRVQLIRSRSDVGEIRQDLGRRAGDLQRSKDQADALLKRVEHLERQAELEEARHAAYKEATKVAMLLMLNKR